MFLDLSCVSRLFPMELMNLINVVGNAFCIFVLTTMIIPLSLFFLLSCLLRMFLRQLINSAPQAGSVLSSLAGKARQAGIEHKEVKEERPSGR